MPFPALSGTSTGTKGERESERERDEGKVNGGRKKERGQEKGNKGGGGGRAGRARENSPSIFLVEAATPWWTLLQVPERAKPFRFPGTFLLLVTHPLQAPDVYAEIMEISSANLEINCLGSRRNRREVPEGMDLKVERALTL